LGYVEILEVIILGDCGKDKKILAFKFGFRIKLRHLGLFNFMLLLLVDYI